MLPASTGFVSLCVPDTSESTVSILISFMNSALTVANTCRAPLPPDIPETRTREHLFVRWLSLPGSRMVRMTGFQEWRPLTCIFICNPPFPPLKPKAISVLVTPNQVD